MAKAREYLRQDVFSRLTSAQEDLATRGVRLSQSTTSGGSSGGDIGKDDAAGARKTDVPTGSGSGMWLDWIKCLSSSNDATSDFLRRQDEYVQDRSRRLRNLERAATPAFHPRLCAASRRLARSYSGEPAPRQQVEGVHVAGSPTDLDDPASYSFQPQINPSSSRRPGRGCFEMSIGDARRRADHKLDLRMKADEALDQQAPFAPDVSSRHGRDPDRPSLAEEPDEYLRHIACLRSGKMMRIERENRLRDEAALAECTFRPQVNAGPPAFVQQMAESYRVTKSFREKENGAEPEDVKPEWR